MTDDRKTSTHYSPLATHASLSWMGDPEDEEEDEEEKKQEEDEEEENEGEEPEVPWQVRRGKAKGERQSLTAKGTRIETTPDVQPAKKGAKVAYRTHRGLSREISQRRVQIPLLAQSLADWVLVLILFSIPSR